MKTPPHSTTAWKRVHPYNPCCSISLYEIVNLKKFCITGDIQKAFLQVRVRTKDRDAQRVLWYNNLVERKIVEYRFTTVIFGATCSPYILGQLSIKHLANNLDQFPQTAQALLDDRYVDDIQYGEGEPTGLTTLSQLKVCQMVDSTSGTAT